MASPMRTAFPTKDEYEKQVASYDAGRPNTAVVPKEPVKFRSAESVGMSAPEPQRPQVATTTAPVSGTDRQFQGLKDAAGSAIVAGANAVGAGARKFMAASNDFTEGKFLGQNPNTAPRPATAMPTGTAQAATPAQSELNTTRIDMANRAARADIEGLKAGEKAIANPLPTPDQVGQIIRDKNGLTNNTVPQTARPGTTLAATEVSPRKPLAYNGAFADGGPQAKAEAALARKQMEVLSAERGSKGLLYGPGSRDYISPTLTEPQMRARQAEIATQRKQDKEDVAAGQIQSATTQMMNDQLTGKTSDRNLAMMPYEQRRAVINDRRALTDLNANMQAKRLEEQGKAEGRAAEMTRAEMEDSTKRRGQDMEVDVQGQKLTSEERRAMATDATTRRGQDIEQQTNLTNAEIAARSKALDRGAMLEAARIRKNAPVDRVKIEAIKGYNKFIGEQIGLRPELQDDPAFLEKAMKLYGLTPQDMQAQMTSANPYDDDEFPTI